MVDLQSFTHTHAHTRTHTHTRIHTLTKVKNLKLRRNALCEFKNEKNIEIREVY